MAMRTRQRMEGFGKWVRETLCEGRVMKAPVIGGRDYDVQWVQPRCFTGNLYPPFSSGEPYSVAPSILVMCGGGDGAGETSEYLDSRHKVHRPDDIAETLEFQLIHAIYEPGTRTGQKTDGRDEPHAALDICDEMDEGTLALMDWMDDTKAALLGADSIPGTDLVVKRRSVRWEPLKENGAVSDRRPVYLGVVAVTFETHTREEVNEEIRGLLD